MAGTRGNIKGKVVDMQTGDALIGANVVVIGTSTGANTDANGEFYVQNLDAGYYTIRVSYVGYKTITVSNLRVSSDLTTYQNIKLPGEDIQVSTVTIVAQKPLIQKDNTNAVRVISSEDIDALPIRSVTNIIGLSAGVVVQNSLIFIRGGRSDEVGYYLEGVTTKNPLTNRNAIAVSQDALQEIQVQSGGYTAEFGDANAGIVRQELKSGGSQLKADVEWITDNIGAQSKADAFSGKKTLGAYWYGYTETSGVLSGPLFTDDLKFFLNINYHYNRDPVPQNYPGISLGKITDPTTSDVLQNFNYPGGAREGVAQQTYTYTGTVNYDLKPVLLRFTGTLDYINGDAGGGNAALGSSPGDPRNYLNSRVGQFTETDGSFTLKLTHVISPTMFYELTGGYFVQTSETYDRALGSNYWAYGDSVANAAAGWTMPRDPLNPQYGPYHYGGYLGVDNFVFPMNGDVPVNYSKFDRRDFNVSGALSVLLGKYNSLKIGGDYTKYELRSWSGVNTVNLASSLNQVQSLYPNVTAAKIDILEGEGVNNYGYDELGNEYSGTGINAPHRPVFASAYAQDKIEFDDLIINLGLRYDYIDVDNLVLKDSSNPDLAISKTNNAIDLNGMVKTPSFSSVSPRLGFSFPVTTTAMFHAQYGNFVQEPQLSNLYEGYYSYFEKIRAGGNFYPTVTGPNLRPTRTTQYELGYTQQLTDFLSFDITGFYRDVLDQVVYIKQPLVAGSAFTAGDYFTLGNGDFATTKGFEISLNMRRYQHIQVNANLSFQDAEGTGSTANADAGLVFQPSNNTIYAPKVVAPLLMNKPFSGNVTVDYRWAENEDSKVFQNFGVSAIMSFNSGHPYTLGYGNLTAESDPRNRSPLEALNSSLTPSVFQVDLRVDKTVNLIDKLNLNIYVYVINLFNIQNTTNVFLKTGNASDDGVLSNPQLSQKLLATYGQDYLNLYRAININYQYGYGGSGTGLGGNDYMYGPPREIRLGLRLEY
jgi:hypothetical protein